MSRRLDTIITPNELLAAARKRLPSPCRPCQACSRRELADLVNRELHRLYPKRKLDSLYVDGRWIGKLERGEHRWPCEERRVALRLVLGVPFDAAVGLYVPRNSAASIIGVGVPPVVGGLSAVADVDLVGGAAESVAEWLARLDGLRWALANQVDADLPARVERQLGILDRLQADGIRRDLAVVDARWSEFMSWVSENVGGLGGGRWLLRARQRAAEAGDATLTAYTLMRQSQRALVALDVRSAIALSREALESGTITPKTQVLCLSRLAEGLAANGDEQALEVVAAARRDLRTADGDHADVVARHCDERYVSAVEGRCRHLLGDAASARTILVDLLREETAADQLDLGMWHVYLGEALAATDANQAGTHGIRALQIAQAAGSFRAVRAAQPLAMALRQHQALPQAAQFVAAHRQLVDGSAKMGPWS